MKLALILPLFLALALPLHADPAEDALREGLRLSRAEDYAGARAAVLRLDPRPPLLVPARRR